MGFQFYDIYCYIKEVINKTKKNKKVKKSGKSPVMRGLSYLIN